MYSICNHFLCTQSYTMIMCKKDDLISSAASYLNGVIGEEMRFSPIDKVLLGTIPTSVSQHFDLYMGDTLGKTVILACMNDTNTLSPQQMQKTLLLLEKRLGHTPIFVAREMAAYNALRLINYKVNFIIPNKQMFLPALLLELKKDRATNTDLSERIPPAAQCLLLYHIEKDSIEGQTAKSLADILQTSYVSMNRAIRWLKKKELIALNGGKTKAVAIACSKRELWVEALPYLESPVERVLFTDQELNMTECGINALSEYTMLNRENRGWYALTKREVDALKEPVDRMFGKNIIQIWRYSPQLLTNRPGVVDKLSLYLSLKDDEDERIQIELENLINEMTW